MAEAQAMPTTVELKACTAVVDALKERETFSSTASTTSGTNSESASDSDSASRKLNKKKVPYTPEASTTSDEPMKIQVPKWPNANHPEIEHILALQKLQEDLEESLKRIVVQAKDAQNYLANTCAVNDQMVWQQQQMYYSQPMFDPCTGLPLGNQYDASPFAPYLLDELAYGPPPLPNYMPTLFEQPAAQWQVPEFDAQGYTPMNKHVKPVAASKKANKGTKTAAAAATSSNEAQESDDMNASGRTVVATKINRLGFCAEKALKDHFAQYGKIDNVCVPQKIKRIGLHNTQGQLRPSGLGFIVMKSEEDAEAILAAGAEHTVCGKVINVRAFKEGQQESIAAVQED